MPIELKITGNHATDLAAEVQSLAEILGVGGVQVTADTKTMVSCVSDLAVSTMNEQITSPKEPAQKPRTASPYGTVGAAKDEAKKALPRKEQDEAVKEMIANGSKDDRFDMLTKGRQNEVEEALAKPTAEPEADLDDMFGDEPENKPVTREDVSALMGKVARDDEGNSIQDKALEIRAILLDHVPQGSEVKVRNIPEDKLATVYALIKKLDV